MSTVTVYSTTYCPYCDRAKALLTKNGVAYIEADVTHDAEKRTWLLQKTGMRTVPQIFFGEHPIGGYTDLAAIVRGGKLEEFLKKAGVTA